jgi:hypothetical protein
MARYIAYAGPRSVQVYRDGVRATYKHGDYSGISRGVNLDTADMALEDLGYVVGHWRWDDERGEWKTVVAPEESVKRARPWAEGKSPEEIRALNMRAFGKPEGR